MRSRRAVISPARPDSESTVQDGLRQVGDRGHRDIAGQRRVIVTANECHTDPYDTVDSCCGFSEVDASVNFSRRASPACRRLDCQLRIGIWHAAFKLELIDIEHTGGTIDAGVGHSSNSTSVRFEVQ